jgi:L-malate glycosyltransferase
MAREIGPGGTERQLVELAKSLDRARFEPHVAYFLEGIRSAELQSAGVRCNRIAVRSFMRPHVLPAALKFSSYLRRHKIQIAHAYDFPLIAFGVPVARAAGVPVVLSSQRGSRTLIPNSYRRIVRWTDHLVNGIVVNCEAMRNHLLNDERVSSTKIRLCYNGLDLDHFSPKPGLTSGANASQPIVVGTVSVQRPEKNIAILLHAFSRVVRQRPNLKLLLVGEGSETSALKGLAREIGIGEKCEFLPSQADVVLALHRIDIFVLPSRTEALSNSLMEAMACGCAVIASRVGGNPELVEHNSTGLLFESDDIDDLATCLETLVERPDLRNQLALAAGERMRSSFSLAASANQMEAIYNEFIARKDSAQRYR